MRLSSVMCCDIRNIESAMQTALSVRKSKPEEREGPWETFAKSSKKKLLTQGLESKKGLWLTKRDFKHTHTHTHTHTSAA